MLLANETPVPKLLGSEKKKLTSKKHLILQEIAYGNDRLKASTLYKVLIEMHCFAPEMALLIQLSKVEIH